MAIQNRRGADDDFDPSKMLPGEFAVTIDGTHKVYACFSAGDVKNINEDIAELPAAETMNDTDVIPVVQDGQTKKVLFEVLKKLLGGSISDEQVQEAVNEYLDEHGVQAGATTEQAEQIEKNTEVINELLTGLSLGFGSDGKLYIMISGVAVGSGVEIDGTVTSSDGIAVFVADFSRESPNTEQFYAWEGRVYDGAVYDALSNIKCVDGVANLTSVYDTENSRWIKQIMCTGGLFESDNFTCKFKAKFCGLAGSWQNVITYGTGTHWTNGMYSDGIKWPAGGEIDAFEQAAGYSENPNYLGPGVHWGTGTESGYPDTHLSESGGAQGTTLPVDEWAEFKFSLKNGIAKYYLNDELIATQDLSAHTVDNNYLCEYKPFLKPQAFYIDGSCYSGSANIHTDYDYNFEVSDFEIYQDENVECTGLEIYPQMWDKGTELIFPIGAELYLDRIYTPISVSNKACKWKSSNTNVATVVQGYVQTLAEGSTTITTTCGSVSATYELTVSETAYIPCAKVAVDNESVIVYEGNEVEVTSYIYPKFTTDAIAWLSTDNEIANVSDGVITGVAPGNCSIVATCGAKSVSIPVTVNEAEKPLISYDFTVLNAYLGQDASDENATIAIINNGSGGSAYDGTATSATSTYDKEGNYKQNGVVSWYNVTATFDEVAFKTIPFAFVYKGLGFENAYSELKVGSYINGTNGNYMPSVAMNNDKTVLDIGYGSATKYNYTIPDSNSNIVVYSDGNTVYVYVNGELLTSTTDFTYIRDSLTSLNFSNISNSYDGFDLYIGKTFTETELITISTPSL